MTKKDFEFIARTIKNMQLTTEDERQKVAIAFAINLGATNPRFDTVWFVKACMPS